MKYITLLLLSFSVNLSLAQDTIVKTNGKFIKAKIVEIEGEKIRYNRYSDLNGPIYGIKKDKVARIIYETEKPAEPKVAQAPSETENELTDDSLTVNEPQYLTVLNGKYFEGKKRIKKREFIKILKSNPYSWNELQRRRNLLSGTVVFLSVGLATGVIGILLDSVNSIQSGGGLMTTGIIVGLFAPSRFWKAIEEYNRSLDKEG